MIPLPIHYSEVERIVADTFGHGVKSLTLLAPKADMGVSTLAYAIARRAGVSGKKTLLIDLNLAKPSQHRRLALERSPWATTDVASGLNPIQLGTTSVSVLTAPSGEISHAFRDPDTLNKMIRHLEERYDAIIVDTSPLLAVNRGNVPSSLVASATDAAVMVVMSGRVSEGDMREATSLCNQASINMVAAIYNDRDDPRLVDEICREISRIDRFLPRLSQWLQSRVKASAFLSQSL